MITMARSISETDTELLALTAEQARLDAKIAATLAEPLRLKKQFDDENSTLPPTDDFLERERQKDFEERATRGKVRNEHKSQRRSLLLLVLLGIASACLVAWGIRLMGH
jgi:hypothetical protein